MPARASNHYGQNAGGCNEDCEGSSPPEEDERERSDGGQSSCGD